ncbi:MAG: exodeoxyribonuclease VII large subunit [Elusimicrobia bacterium]|nr:exodeoxyribonuclease VII large subunit [Elusimicrobiota bacterium]
MDTTAKIYTVTELNNKTKIMLEREFKGIILDGELSNFKKYSSGHCYFSLKDSGAQISGVMYRFKAARLTFTPKDGMKVRVKGTVTLYPVRGSYQILVDQMHEKGVGELQKKFEELKKKLKEEGLFDKSRKRPLPSMPQKIGVVTSPTGAAIRDVLTVLKRRFSNIHVIINPVRVQGAEAPGEIAGAIEEMNTHFPDIDVLIVGRGGGSLEDLWAFNEEIVARAIFASKIPVISAVGHEVDWMISDFTADVRAATPSVAAEIVLGRKEELLKSVDSAVVRMKNGMRKKISVIDDRLDTALRRPYLREPALFMSRFEQGFDIAFEGFVTAKDRMFENYTEKADRLTGRLNILSPRSTLARGYSIAQKVDGTVIKKASDVKTGERINVRLDRGSLGAEVLDMEGK